MYAIGMMAVVGLVSSMFVLSFKRSGDRMDREYRKELAELCRRAHG